MDVTGRLWCFLAVLLDDVIPNARFCAAGCIVVVSLCKVRLTGDALVPETERYRDIYFSGQPKVLESRP